MTAEIHELQNVPPQRASSNGGENAKDLHGRVSAIEARLDCLATKEDIKNVERRIAEHASSVQPWLMGILAASLGAAILALFRTFS